MRGLKITLLLVLIAAFVYCDQFKNYYHGQYPLIQSRGLDVLSLKRNDNSYARRSNSAQTSQGMNLRGNLDVAASSDNWNEEQPHHWRIRGQSDSRARGVSDDSDTDVIARGEEVRRQEQRANAERQDVHTHHWRPEQNQASRSRGASDNQQPMEHVHTHVWRQDPYQEADSSDEQSSSRARTVRDADSLPQPGIHTHVWRQEPYQEQEEREARLARDARSSNSAEDDVIDRGEEARRQEAVAEEQSRKKTRNVPSEEDSNQQPGVHTHVWRQDPYQEADASDEQSSSRARTVRDVDTEQQQQQQPGVHTHVWRQEPYQEQESRSRNIVDENIVNQAEDARLREVYSSGENVADIESQFAHTHVWRQEPYQEADQNAADEQQSRSRTVRDVDTEQQQQPGVHTHVWRQDPYQEADSSDDSSSNDQQSRSRTVRDVDTEQQQQSGPMDHVHTHVWRQDPYQEADSANEQSSSRARTVRDVDTEQQVQQQQPGPMDHVHTHVWRQEPYQEQEEREARLAREYRLRNMRSTEEQQQIDEGEIHSRHEGEGDQERIHHGQHVPDSEGFDSVPETQPRSEEMDQQVHYHIPHGLQADQPNGDTQASETSQQTNIAIN